ncbi:hypothetical protein COMNV_01623 [Commensalibacter sp. Nvir]|nr:hypothetical protein COMNV_01623 [Commensalibacter sp. Nvir]
MKHNLPPIDKHYVYTTHVTDPKTGKIRYAKAYGIRAFRILVKD